MIMESPKQLQSVISMNIDMNPMYKLKGLFLKRERSEINLEDFNEHLQMFNYSAISTIHKWIMENSLQDISESVFSLISQVYSEESVINHYLVLLLQRIAEIKDFEKEVENDFSGWQTEVHSNNDSEGLLASLVFNVKNEYLDSVNKERLERLMKVTDTLIYMFILPLISEDEYIARLSRNQTL